MHLHLVVFSSIEQESPVYYSVEIGLHLFNIGVVSNFVVYITKPIYDKLAFKLEALQASVLPFLLKMILWKHALKGANIFAHAFRLVVLAI